MELKNYQQSPTEVAREYQVDITSGLTTDEVKHRQAKYGINTLSEQKNTTLIQKFIGQFKDLMIIVLLVAALVAAFAGEGVDTLIILLVVVLNAIFGVFQEAKAEQAITALKTMSAPQAHVIREGKTHLVPASELVPGDIVLLEAGDIVPADLRLIQSASLRIDEAMLTGESIPVEKDINALTSDDLPLGDRTNLAFMNSNVTYGRGQGIVIGIGMTTEVGQIATMLTQAKVNETPLQANLRHLGKTLTWLILIIAVVVFIVGMLNHQHTWIDMLLVAIALAVAAIPEGLPAIVTITLALGTTRMAKQQALIRKLPAVETLGATEVIGSDKTGTLTQNKMTIEKYYVTNKIFDSQSPLNVDAQMLADVMALNNDTKLIDNQLVGDPTETALISFNQKHTRNLTQLFEQHKRVAEIPFDSERKLMTTVNEFNDEYLITVKGAPDQLLDRVTQILIDGHVVPLTHEIKNNILEQNHLLATQALRVLAFAYQKSPVIPAELTSQAVENDLIFVGLVGMIDPERPEVKAAVADAKAAGIKPLMITGDHRDTAAAIAMRLGILTADDHDAIITGAQLDQLDEATFMQKVEQYVVYARVAPEHKVRIVKAWQAKGKVVAMTGDGVNDAPALKNADIGIAMGITGTEVSKGAADMVLADDNFATIISAVKEGRKVFANIQKAIQYLLSANLGEVLTLFIMTLMGWSILAPVHILWINLVTDTLPAIALGVEPAEKQVMHRQPRGRLANFLSNGVQGAIVYQGFLEGILTLGVYWIAITFPIHANDALAHADALTMAYVTLGLLQLVHAFSTKSVYQSIFTIGVFKNKFFNWSILIAGILLSATVFIPGLNGLFHVTPLDTIQWATILVAAFLMVAIVEIVKFGQRHFANKI
ncbi:cation-translocating P-type ATPase [Periweissella fabalis]|uniref:P-type Ca(2+) transporter n=1 Tax=Periweissella fabalis TaxID=1070421 RepID=A0A7X6S2T3_9LACO|nr:cation-translocating P-type ATPase [Periweissella fabalis]MCM0599785.1 cation-translocating P-type ATPase [Periweissella fabalis]NKZ24409.1 cation-translocating P-type ATPase [Periweissella fabalis]